MKNLLLNLFPRNPTQTRLRRFRQVPWGEWNTDFDRVKREFDRVKKSALDPHIGELK